MAKVKQICEEKIKPIIEEMGFELVDVEYLKEAGGMSLIFTIDSDADVTIEDCENVSKKIDPVLDELNPTDDAPYTLIVSSRGLDRPLKTDKDLKKNLGSDVTLTLFSKQDNKKKFEGTLIKYDEKTVTIKVKEQELTFDKEKIANIKLIIKF